jgi:hypothetical protein
MITSQGTWNYEYDVFGNRTATIHNGQRTEYLIDPAGLGNVFAEYDGSGSVRAHFVHGLGLVSRIDAAGPAAYFQLGDFGFGDLVVDVPSGRQFYSTRLDLRATRGVFVDVKAELNRDSRVANWTITALDPKTLDIPADPFTGFLPPDKTPPEGQGFLNYSIRPKADSPTGTRIDAQATIVFDTNDPIDTPRWVNTLDLGPPTSSVSPLPAISDSASFTVNWSGTDDADGTGGSGIAFFDIYVSDNGGPFELSLDDTRQRSATFVAQPEHTYRFYSVATDNVGHVQSGPSGAQASTTVRPDQPGDANRDGIFGPLDIIMALLGNKYQTGQPATWEEGDWNGDRKFDSLDLVAALQGGKYRAGPSVPGDSNLDERFDQQDLVQVLQAGKYLTGQTAKWTEGDWNGDRVFDQLDIVTVQLADTYLRGPQAALFRRANARP